MLADRRRDEFRTAEERMRQLTVLGVDGVLALFFVPAESSIADSVVTATLWTLIPATAVVGCLARTLQEAESADGLPHRGRVRRLDCGARCRRGVGSYEAGPPGRHRHRPRARGPPERRIRRQHFDDRGRRAPRCCSRRRPLAVGPGLTASTTGGATPGEGPSRAARSLSKRLSAVVGNHRQLAGRRAPAGACTRRSGCDPHGRRPYAAEPPCRPNRRGLNHATPVV